MEDKNNYINDDEKSIDKTLSNILDNDDMCELYLYDDNIHTVNDVFIFLSLFKSIDYSRAKRIIDDVQNNNKGIIGTFSYDTIINDYIPLLDDFRFKYDIILKS